MTPNEPRHGLIPGTLTLLILKAVSWGPVHGYAISRWIQGRSDDVLCVEEGVLYPALHRLEKEGLLRSAWGVNDTGRKAKFYRLTAKGRRSLNEEIARWERSSAAVQGVLAAGAREPLKPREQGAAR